MGAVTAIAAIGIFTNVVGTAQQVASYHSAGRSGVSAAQYNVKLIDLNLQRQQDVLAGELRSFTAKQKSDIASSGVSVTSKSALLAMSQSLSKFETESRRLTENAEFEKAHEIFAARQQQKAFKLQARDTAIAGIFGLGTSLLSLFGGSDDDEAAA